MRYLLALLVLASTCWAQTQTVPLQLSTSGVVTINGIPTTIGVNLSGSLTVTPQPVTPSAPGNGYQLVPPPQDANGWTIMPVKQSGREVYVSYSGGNDSNSGLTSSVPVKTPAAAWALTTIGNGDHVFFKCGDVWPNTVISFPSHASGRSRTDPLIVTNYSTGARPRFQTGTNTAIHRSGSALQHAWIVGLDFYCDAGDPASGTFVPGSGGGQQGQGVDFLGENADFQLEDCRFEFYSNGISIQSDGVNPAPSDIRIRRCEILDSYSSVGSHAQGLYAFSITNLLLDGNIFDHNGWNTGVNGADRTIFNHNVYTLECTKASFVNNIFANASNFGLTTSTTNEGATYTNLLVQGNLLYGNANGMTCDAALTTATIKGNVFTRMGGSPGGVDQSAGLFAGNSTTVSVTGNYFIDSPLFGNAPSLSISAHALTGFTFTGNFLAGWGSEDGAYASIVNNGSPLTSVTLTPNLHRAAASNWSRTLPLYNAYIGGPGTLDNWDGLIRSQSKGTWQVGWTATGAVTWIGGGS